MNEEISENEYVSDFEIRELEKVIHRMLNQQAKEIKDNFINWSPKHRAILTIQEVKSKIHKMTNHWLDEQYNNGTIPFEENS